MKTLTLIMALLTFSLISAQEKNTMDKKVNKTEEEWKQILSPQQYYVFHFHVFGPENLTSKPEDDKNIFRV